MVRALYISVFVELLGRDNYFNKQCFGIFRLILVSKSPGDLLGALVQLCSSFEYSVKYNSSCPNSLSLFALLLPSFQCPYHFFAPPLWPVVVHKISAQPKLPTRHLLPQALIPRLSSLSFLHVPRTNHLFLHAWHISFRPYILILVVVLLI
jgi:hypothetical protein